MFFELPQEIIAVGLARKFNRHTSLIVGHRGWRGAKIAATQPAQPRQCRPSELVNHCDPNLPADLCDGLLASILELLVESVDACVHSARLHIKKVESRFANIQIPFCFTGLNVDYFACGG